MSRFDKEEVVLPKGDPERGKQLYEFKCSACHSIGDDNTDLSAPTLKNIMGKKIGSTSYHYSKSMKTCHEYWTEKSMFLFLRDPKQYFRDTKMFQTKIANPQERADIIEYLKSL